MIYTDAVTVTLSDYSGTTYYTLDGSNPLDIKNIARRVYVEPFKVLPIGNNIVNLHVATIQPGHKSATTYPDNPTVIEFSFICNPWRISESSMDYGVATVTEDDTLKMYTGVSLERSKGFTGDYFYGFDILDAIGNSSLVFGLKSYLGVVNNLSEGEYTTKWKSPSLTILDRVDDVITCCVGYRRGLGDKNHFDEIGRFDWNINEPLPVIAYFKDEIVTPSNSIVYRASDLHERVSIDGDTYLDELFGITVSSGTPKNIVIYDIPANTKVFVYVDMDSIPDSSDIFITKKGNAPGSELVISTTWGLFEMDDVYKLRDESTINIYKGDGAILSKLDNFTAYRTSKNIKLNVNGLETEYVRASNVNLDYIMMNLMEVNSELDSYIEIGNVKGGCL